MQLMLNAHDSEGTCIAIPVLLPLLLVFWLLISGQIVCLSESASLNSCYIPLSVPPDDNLSQGSVQHIQALRKG